MHVCTTIEVFFIHLYVVLYLKSYHWILQKNEKKESGSAGSEIFKSISNLKMMDFHEMDEWKMHMQTEFNCIRKLIEDENLARREATEELIQQIKHYSLRFKTFIGNMSKESI